MQPQWYPVNVSLPFNLRTFRHRHQKSWNSRLTTETEKKTETKSQVTENVGLISVSAMENDYDVFCATFS
eukprot:12386.XXX_218369_217364_1 [CDS] Oithona nana genome sequencing.